MNDEVLTEAALDAFEITPSPSADPVKIADERKRALRKAKSLLRKPHVKMRLAEIYELEKFDIMDAVRMHIKHIKGFERQVVDERTGELMTVQDPPNYAALKDYWKMTLPEAPKTLNVNQRSVNVNATFEEALRSTMPQISARVIGKAKVRE